MFSAAVVPVKCFHEGVLGMPLYGPWSPGGGQCASTDQILLKSVELFLRYCDLSIFQDSGNRWNTFDNIKFSIFGAFGLKTPIHTPEIGVLGNLTF